MPVLRGGCEETCPPALYLFVEFLAGLQCVLDGVLMVWSVEVEEFHRLSMQSLQAGPAGNAHCLVSGSFRLRDWPWWQCSLEIQAIKQIADKDQ